MIGRNNPWSAKGASLGCLFSPTCSLSSIFSSEDCRYARIGELDVMVDFLKKKLSKEWEYERIKPAVVIRTMTDCDSLENIFRLNANCIRILCTFAKFSAYEENHVMSAHSAESPFVFAGR